MRSPCSPATHYHPPKDSLSLVNGKTVAAICRALKTTHLRRKQRAVHWYRCSALLYILACRPDQDMVSTRRTAATITSMEASDTEAPEEVSLQTGKSEAAERRKHERHLTKSAQRDAKEKRRRLSGHALSRKGSDGREGEKLLRLCHACSFGALTAGGSRYHRTWLERLP